MSAINKKTVRSMTGYGRGEAEAEGSTWVVEVRTVNHRFLDTRVVLPKGYAPFEEKLRKIIGEIQERGRVELTVQQQTIGGNTQLLSLNINLAEQYHRCLQQISEELGLGYQIRISDMLTLRDIISQQEATPDFDREWSLVEQAARQALLDCRAMREQEGYSLKEELSTRLAGFAETVSSIEKEVPELLRIRQQELAGRFERFLEGIEVDPVRLAQEAAILADKADVTEELVRLKSHIKQFQDFLACGEAVGRRLDFLLQEFLREVNTLASKINSSKIAHSAVEMKNEVEKLKEQVQNLE